MSNLQLVSAFDGIGGFPRAFATAGIETVATIEIDKAAAGVTAHHYPPATHFADITEVTPDDILGTGFDPVRGVLSAGWPCQGNSMAGKRGGLADPRSGLWKQAVRLLAGLRPAWFVGENVPGLLTVNGGDDMRVVMSDLESLGYLVELDIYDAQFFGVPQRRRRLVFTCRNLDRLLAKRTTSSALTLAQCLTEISLITFIAHSQAYGKECAPWVSPEACADGLARRIRQFGMRQEAESGWPTWLPVLVGDSARRALASGSSGWPHGGSIAAALGWTATATSSSDSTDPGTGTSFAAESSWKKFLDDLYALAKSSTTSRPTSSTISPETSISARMLLNISAYTAALSASCPSFSGPASSASTAIEVLTNYARSTGSNLFAVMGGVDDFVELTPVAEDLLVALRHLGDAAGPAEVLLEPEGGIRDLAAGRTVRAGAARDAADGARGAGATAPTLQGGGRRGYRVDAELAAGGGLIEAPVATTTTALTRNGITGLDDNTAQGNQLVAMPLTAREGKGPDSDVTSGNVVVEPEVWQQQGSKLQPMGTMRRGNGNVTGGVPFLAHTLTSVGADASEDRTGRGLPMVAFGLRVSGPGQSGTAQGWNTNLLPVDLAQVTSKENRSNPQPGDPAGTLASTGRPAVAFGEAQDMAASEGLSPSVRTGTGGSQVGVAVPAAAVRRLTPVECERLQGFPDGWTARRVDLVLDGNRWAPRDPVAEPVEQADSARYRQLGNSIAGPVFEWVAEGVRLVDEDAKRNRVE